MDNETQTNNLDHPVDPALMMEEHEIKQILKKEPDYTDGLPLIILGASIAIGAIVFGWFTRRTIELIVIFGIIELVGILIFRAGAKRQTFAAYVQHKSYEIYPTEIISVGASDTQVYVRYNKHMPQGPDQPISVQADICKIYQKQYQCQVGERGLVILFPNDNSYTKFIPIR